MEKPNAEREQQFEYAKNVQLGPEIFTIKKNKNKTTYFAYKTTYFVSKIQISLHGRRHASYFLNGNQVQMTSQLQYSNLVERFLFCNSQNHEYSQFKIFGMILFYSGIVMELHKLGCCHSNQRNNRTK